MIILALLSLAALAIIFGFAIVTDPYVERHYGKAHSEDTQ